MNGDVMTTERLYADKDLNTILRRASELQRLYGVAETPGLSLAELQQVADDVGINPDFVRQAAVELEEGITDGKNRLLGGPTDLQLEWIVDEQMSQSKWDESVGLFRHTFGADGREILDGPSREWIHKDQMGGRVRISASPAETGTRMRVSYGMTEWLWLHVVFLSVGIGAVAVIYSLLNIGVLIETGLALLTMMAFYMVGWIVYHTFSRRQGDKMRQLLARMDRLMGKAERAATVGLDSDARDKLKTATSELDAAFNPLPSGGEPTRPSERLRVR
ncbi:MAG: hypothetical protein R3282_09980 [Rhodothermales bacterium]|nr:hypothetical protein [Rhodothermales bacterium]